MTMPLPPGHLAPSSDPDADLAAVRVRHEVARMAGTHAEQTSQRHDVGAIGAVVASWQDVAPLHDELNRLRPVLRALMDAAVEAATAGHPMPLPVGYQLLRLDTLIHPAGRLKAALEADRRRSGLPAALPPELTPDA